MLLFRRVTYLHLVAPQNDLGLLVQIALAATAERITWDVPDVLCIVHPVVYHVESGGFYSTFFARFQASWPIATTSFGVSMAARCRAFDDCTFAFPRNLFTSRKITLRITLYSKDLSDT